MLTIAEVSERSGVAASALRYYERERLLPRAPRIGGHRVFEEEVLNRLVVIQVAKVAGFSVGEIRVLLEGLQGGRAPSARLSKMMERKREELEDLSKQVARMKRVAEAIRSSPQPTLETCVRAIAAETAE